MSTNMEVVKIENLSMEKFPMNDQVLQRRLKTAERVRRFRERKKLQQASPISTPPNPQVILQQRLKASERMRRYRQRKKLRENQLSNYVYELQETSELMQAVEVEDKVNIIQSRSKEQADPMGLVNVHLSVDEEFKSSQFEEVVVGVEEFRPPLGPNIRGTCYCVKKRNEFSQWSRFDDVDFTSNYGGGDENIFTRKCAGMNCRGCVIKVTSPIEKFQIPCQNLLQCISTYCTKVATLNIAGQKGLPEATYNLLSTLTQDDLIITSQQFTRMWRSFLLRRVQEVESKTTCLRLPNMIRLDCTGLLVPAPLSDLLHSIGRFHSTTTGIMHHTVTPVKPPTNPADWWSLDDDVLTLWIHTMNALKDKFLMKQTPSAANFDDKPLVMTQIEITDEFMVQCRSRTTEINLTDGYIHMVNDPLYKPGIYEFKDCHLILSTPINQDYLRREYLSSFIIHEEVCY